VRILWLKTELLHPVDKGGKIRTYYMLRALKARHRITYLTLDDGAAAPDARERAAEYCHELATVPHRTAEKFSAHFYVEVARNLVSSLPYAIRKYQSAPMRSAIVKRADPSVADLVVCDFLAPSINVPGGLRTGTVLFQHNVEAMIWKRHAEVQRGRFKRAFLRREWRLMRRFEARQCRRFDCVVAVSPEDRETMRREYGVRTVEDVPTGVDVEFFRPAVAAVPAPDSLVFTGSMDWLPNQDAMDFFVTEVMPRIVRVRPNVTLTVVGRNPSPKLLQLASRNPAIKVTGRVDDVRPYMENAAVYIVPIRVGGGTRLKIFEAMAMERPIVSTTVGAEGLPIEDGRNMVVADSAPAFANAVVGLLADANRARGIAEYAARQVRARYGWDGVAARFAEICEQAVRPALAPTG
jgi:glycosyltransferase involved in cell wall biosynthesis